MMKIPREMKKGPGALPSLFNALRDFVLGDRPIFEKGSFEESETVKGRLVRLPKSILEH